MRWNIKRGKLLLGLLPIVALLFYILTANHNLFADRSYVAIDLSQNINDTLPLPTDDSLPTDYTAQQNFAIAAGVINNKQLTPFYSSVTTGAVVANLMNYTQEVENTKAVKGNAVFSESLSLSTFASVAEQKYFDNNYIMYRKAKTSGKKVVSWPNEVKEMGDDVFAAKYGVIPREITKYSVTKDAVLGGELVKQDNDMFTFTMQLNAEMAQKYAKREMMTFANVSQDPKFFDCSITFTIDKNWRVHKVDSYDFYEISMMGGLKCTSNLSETFLYEGDMPERAQIFVDYVPTGDNDEVVTEKSAADYLQEGFGDYISGTKQLNLKADILIGTENLSLTANIDLKNGQYKFKVGDIFVAYTGADLYIQNQKHKGLLSGADIKKLTTAFNMDLSSVTGAFNDPDILGKLFENSVISQNETHVFIPMIFNLMGIDFDVTLNLKKVDSTVIAEGISGKIDLSGLLGSSLIVNANIALVDSVAMPELNPVQHTSYSGLINALINTVKANGVNVNANIALGGKINTTVNVDASIINTNNSIGAKAVVTVLNQKIELTYLNGIAYIKLGNIMVQAAIADIPEMLEALSNFGISTDTANLIGQILPSILPEPISVNSILKILNTASYNGSNLSINTGLVSLEVSHNDISITSVKVNGFALGGVTADIVANISLNNTDSQITVTDKDSYSNLKNVTQFIPAIVNLINAKGYDFSLNGSVDLNGVAYPFNGQLVVARGDKIGVKFSLNVLSQQVILTYLNDEIFITIGAFNAKIHAVNGVNAFITAFNAAATKYPTVMQSVSTDSAMVTNQLINKLLENQNALEDLLSGAIKSIESFSLKNNEIALKFSVQNITATANILLNSNNKLSLNLSAQILDFGFNLSIASTSIYDSCPVIQLAPNNYLNLQQLTSFIEPVFNLMAAKSYALDVSVNLKDVSGKTETARAIITINRGNTMGVSGSINVANAYIDFALVDNVIYLKAQNIMLKLNLSDLERLASQLSQLLPSGDSVVAILPLLNDILPELSFKGITDMLAGLQITDSAIILPITAKNGNTATMQLNSNGQAFTCISLTNLKMHDYTINFTANLITSLDNTQVTIPNGAGNYIDITSLTKFIQPALNLASAKAFTIDISSGTINTPYISGDFSGTVTINANPLSVKAQLKFRTHELMFALVDNQIYLQINNIKLTLNIADIDEIAEIVNSILPQPQSKATSNLLEGLLGNLLTGDKNTILGALTGGLNMQELLNSINSLTLNDNGDLIAIISFGEFSLSIKLNVNQRGEISANILNINYGTVITDSSVNTIIKGYDNPLNIHVSNTETYVDVADLASYIKPISNTLKQDYYHVNFGGSVVAADKTTTISGEIKAIPKGNFADFYVRINLSDTTNAKHEAILHIIDNRDKENGEIDAYFNYNGFKVTISHLNALKIVGAVRDIMGLKIPFLDDMLNGVYQPLDTSVFDTLDIAGIADLRDSINSIFKIAEDASDSTGGGSDITGALTEGLIDSILSGVSLSYNNQILAINIDNGIFEPLNKGIQAEIALTHDTNQLTGVSINNLIVNGDSVNFSATLSCLPLEPITAPTGYRDFNFIDDLLRSLITTAGMREFEITGSLEMALIGLIKPSVPLNVKVKILDDGSTAAAIKLSVPFVSGGVFVALTKTDSYIYFANNRLYFIVDVWNSWAWSAGSYTHTETMSASVDEFLANPTKYLFFILRMADIIKNPINDAINKGNAGNSGTTDINKILKNFSANASNYNLKLGLSELTGNSDLNDINVDITTDQNYITNLKFSTSFVGAVDLNLGNGVNLINIKEENGVKCGANPSSNVSFGNAHNSGKTLRIDNLEDDLAKIFVIEAAETFADKTDNFTARTARASTAVEKSISSAQQAQQKRDESYAEYIKAENYLSGLNQNAFGYEIALNRYQRANAIYQKADITLSAANANRSTVAQSALNTTGYILGMLDKTATAADLAANFKSDNNTIKLRASGAAAQATNSILNALKAANSSINNVLIAANADSNTALADKANQLKLQLAQLSPTVSLKAANAAINAGNFAATIMENSSIAANAAANAGNANEAFAKSDESLIAIQWVEQIVVAANLSAKLSTNEQAIAAALQLQNSVQQKLSQAANAATMAAVYAANTISQNAVTNADASVVAAQSNNPTGAINYAVTTLAQIQNAFTAANCANLATKYATDPLLIQSATLATTTANQRAKQSANTLLASMQISASLKAAEFSEKTATAANSTSADNVNSALDVIDQLTVIYGHAKSAYALNPTTENLILLEYTKNIQLNTLIQNAPKLANALNTVIVSADNDVLSRASTVKNYRRNGAWTYGNAKTISGNLNNSINWLNNMLTAASRLNTITYNILSAQLTTTNSALCSDIISVLTAVKGTTEGGQQSYTLKAQNTSAQALESAQTFYNTVNGDIWLASKEDALTNANNSMDSANNTIQTAKGAYSQVSMIQTLLDSFTQQLSNITTSMPVAA